jgi:ribosomal protein L34E
MSLFYTSDPVADFANYDREQAKRLAKLPKCDRCRKPIQDEYLFDFYGDVYCERCAMRLFRREVNIDE